MEKEFVEKRADRIDKSVNEKVNEAEANYAPFSFSSFELDRKKKKKLLIIVCIAVAVIGLIIMGSVVQLFPSIKFIMEWQEGDPEPSGVAGKALLVIAVGFLIVAAVTAAVGVTFYFVYNLVVSKKYNADKSRALKEYEDKKREYLASQRACEWRMTVDKLIRSECEICGGNLIYTHRDAVKEQKGYVETVYDVKATGYDTATLTPRDVSHLYTETDYSNAYYRYTCPNCGYTLNNKHWAYDKSDISKYTTELSLTENSIVTEELVEETELYHRMKGTFVF